MPDEEALRAGRRGGGSLFATVLAVFVVLLHAVVWWRAAAWYPQLPEQIPMHFDGSGAPDRWSPKSVGAWFLLPAIAAGMMLFLGAIGWGLGALVRNTPGLCNMPKKELFLKLSPEGRMIAVAPTRLFLLATMALFQGMFAWMVEGSARVAMGTSATLAVWPVFVVVGGVLVLLVPYFVATGRAIEREARREGVIDGPVQSRDATTGAK
ncbi:MAG: hypothetical protein RI967_847 [Planctomycetota bacterium]